MAAAKRIAKELEKIAEEPSSSFTITSADAQAHTCSGVMHGPKGSPYENGDFSFRVSFPPKYPFEPPEITFETPLFHPMHHTFPGPSSDGAKAMIRSMAMHAHKDAPEIYSGVSVRTLTDNVHKIDGNPAQMMTLGQLYEGIQDKIGVSLDQMALVIGYSNDKSDDKSQSLTRVHGRRLPPYANKALCEETLMALGVVPGKTEVTLILGASDLSGTDWEGSGLRAGLDDGLDNSRFWSPGFTLAKLLNVYAASLLEPTMIPAWMAPPADATLDAELAAAFAMLDPKKFANEAAYWTDKLAKASGGHTSGESSGAAVQGGAEAVADGAVESNAGAADAPATVSGDASSGPTSGCCVLC